VLNQIKRKDDNDSELPNVKQGDVLSLKALDPKQHFTKPIARFNEASLVKELEKRGVGRPSTYANIISTIQDRGYVRLENKRFYAEKMGEIVTDRLVNNFSDLISYDFTANMEQRLDDIAHGELEWKRVLDNFYAEFSEQLGKAELPTDEGGMLPNQAVPIDVDCPKCSRHMNVRTASTGVFLGCSGYNLPPKERCTYDGPIIECDKCQSDMELKNGRFGKYFGCTNEECKNTRKLLRNGEAAPPKEDPVFLPELECENSDAHFVLRDGASGIFLAASTFPRSRETRAPKVIELAQFRDRISPKFYYLADAPKADPDGNPTIVRYSRKTKQQYVMSEDKDKKATGWAAWYQDGKWVADDKRKSPKAKPKKKTAKAATKTAAKKT